MYVALITIASLTFLVMVRALKDTYRIKRELLMLALTVVAYIYVVLAFEGALCRARVATFRRRTTPNMVWFSSTLLWYMM